MIDFQEMDQNLSVHWVTHWNEWMRWNWSIHVSHTYAIDIGKPSATSLIKNHPHFWYLCIDLWVRVEYLYYIYGTTNCEATHRLQSDICQCRYFDYVSEILVRRTLKILFRINWIVSGFFLCVCALHFTHNSIAVSIVARQWHCSAHFECLFRSSTRYNGYIVPIFPV